MEFGMCERWWMASDRNGYMNDEGKNKVGRTSEFQRTNIVVIIRKWNSISYAAALSCLFPSPCLNKSVYLKDAVFL